MNKYSQWIEKLIEITTWSTKQTLDKTKEIVLENIALYSQLNIDK